MSFRDNKFYYNMPDDSFSVNCSSIIRFEFSIISTTEVMHRLILHYKDTEGKEMAKQLDYFSFPANFLGKPLVDVLNQLSRVKE